MSDLEAAQTTMTSEHQDIDKNLDRLYAEKDRLIKEED